MNAYYTTKHWLKVVRWHGRRWATELHWGREYLQKSPAVLGNAMPKSGSHLVSQIIQGLPKIGPFINPGFMPITRAEDNSKLSDNIILKNIQQMRPGDIAYGYVNAREPFTTTLGKTGRATVFVFRDPRDVIISHVFYATQMHEEHGMHRYYTQVLKTMQERINAAIQGVEEPGAELSSILEKYENYLGWFDQTGVLCLRFEDLILDRQAALKRFLEYLSERGFIPQMPHDQAMAILEQAIVPQKSGTFRKGRPGSWQEHFTETNKTMFKEVAGDLLIRLGYEENKNW
jgi:hypothetical protein